MPKKNKLKLNDISVQSFLTEDISPYIKGGAEAFTDGVNSCKTLYGRPGCPKYPKSKRQDSNCTC